MQYKLELKDVTPPLTRRVKHSITLAKGSASWKLKLLPDCLWRIENMKGKRLFQYKKNTAFLHSPSTNSTQFSKKGVSQSLLPTLIHCFHSSFPNFPKSTWLLIKKLMQDKELFQKREDMQSWYGYYLWDSWVHLPVRKIFFTHKRSTAVHESFRARRPPAVGLSVSIGVQIVQTRENLCEKYQ